MGCATAGIEVLRYRAPQARSLSEIKVLIYSPCRSMRRKNTGSTYEPRHGRGRAYILLKQDVSSVRLAYNTTPQEKLYPRNLVSKVMDPGQLYGTSTVFRGQINLVLE